MCKKRNAQAVAAWNRKGGAHNEGTKRPDVEDWQDELLEDEEESSDEGER